MRGSESSSGRRWLETAAAGVLLVAAPVLHFWRGSFFYIRDDYTALCQMATETFLGYVNAADAEQWFPVFHVVYYALVGLFASRYDILLLVNCLLTGVCAFLLYRLFRRYWSWRVSVLLALLYAVSEVHAPVVWHSYNICYGLALLFYLLGLLAADAYVRRPGPARLVLCGLLAGAAILSHSYAIMAIASFPLYGLVLGGERRWSRFVRLGGAVLCVYILFALGYMRFAGMGAAHSQAEGPIRVGWRTIRFLAAGALSRPVEIFSGDPRSFMGVVGIAMVFLVACMCLLLLLSERGERRVGLGGTLLVLGYWLLGVVRPLWKYPGEVFYAGRYSSWAAFGSLRAYTILVGVVALAWLIQDARSHRGDVRRSCANAVLFYGAVVVPLFMVPPLETVGLWAMHASSAVIIAGLLLVLALASDRRQMSFALWGLGANIIGFSLVSLLRSQMDEYLFFALRYAIFNLLGFLVLFGAAWNSVAERLAPHRWVWVLPIPVLVASFVLQSGKTWAIEQDHLRLANMSRAWVYSVAPGRPAPERGKPDIDEEFVHPWLTPGEMRQIIYYLRERRGWDIEKEAQEAKRGSP